MRFAACAAAGFLAATLLFLPNRWPLVLALPALGFICAYSYAKRFTWLSHFWLGAALMLAPLSVWISLRADATAQQPLDMLPAVILGLAVLLWVAGFDIIYACQDVEFDRHAELHSVPARFGIRRALHMAALCHAGMMATLATLPLTGRLGGPEVELGWFYWISLAAISALLAYEHWIVRPDDLTRVNDAFFRVNAVISVGLLLVVTADLWLW